MDVFLQVMVLFILMLAGLAAAKARWLTREGFSGLNKFVIYFAIPGLIIAKLQVKADAALLFELLTAFLIATIAMLACGALTYFLYRKDEPRRRAVFTNLAMFSNCGFMGYPVVEARFGSGALIYAVMFVTSFNLLAWTVGGRLFGEGKPVPMRVLLSNPAIIAVAIGLLCLVLQITIPAPFSNVLTLLGNTTTPVSLVVIGAQLHGIHLSSLNDKGLTGTLLLRLIAYPLLLLAVMRLLRVPDPMAATLFLCYAMPSAALTAMQAEYFDGDQKTASAGVAISTALSMATIPLMLLMIA